MLALSTVPIMNSNLGGDLVRMPCKTGGRAMLARHVVAKRAMLAALAAIVGVGGFVGPLPLEAASASTVADVAAQNFAFVPANVSIASGDSVRWTNNDPAQHTVTADDGSFDSGTLNQGQTFTLPFSTSGVVHYFCRFHGSPGSGMIGTVTVGGGGGGTPSIAIADKRVTETDAGTTKTAAFLVTRSGNTTGSSTVKFSTANGTAMAGSDYTAVSSKTLTFAAGVTTMRARVKVIGDNVHESTETYSVNLSAPTGATISDATGVGTIVDND